MLSALGSAQHFGTDLFFNQLYPMQFPANKMTHFTPWPECGGHAGDTRAEYSGESQVRGLVRPCTHTPAHTRPRPQIIFNFYYGPSDMGLISPALAPQLARCGVGMAKVDLASPALMRQFTWSWAPGHPSRSADHDATVLDARTSRWTSVDANATGSLRVACAVAAGDPASPPTWKLSSAAVPFPRSERARAAACADVAGADLRLPRSAHENWLLVQQMAAAKVDTVWLIVR